VNSRLLALKYGAVALIGLAPALHAVRVSAENGYLTYGVSERPVRNGDGNCVHEREWRPSMRFADCEPASTKPVGAAETAAPVAAAPEPAAPVAAAPAPQPISRNVPFRLSTGALFDFDKATLKPEGEAVLDDVASQLAGLSYDAVAIVGYADRIGAPGYNQTLSERRAKAVRDYLVSRGADSQKIEAAGLGSSHPTTRCTGLRGAKLIACLQPDRHAELTILGTAVEVSAAPAN
jgi:OOP family OmpA-OmpF porin